MSQSPHNNEMQRPSHGHSGGSPLISVLGVTSMSSRKQHEEMELVRRFLELLGHSRAQLKCGDRPDLVAVIDGQRVGIEETKFHADEQPGNSGSPLRAARSTLTFDRYWQRDEEKRARPNRMRVK